VLANASPHRRVEQEQLAEIGTPLTRCGSTWRVGAAESGGGPAARTSARLGDLVLHHPTPAWAVKWGAPGSRTNDNYLIDMPAASSSMWSHRRLSGRALAAPPDARASRQLGLRPESWGPTKPTAAASSWRGSSGRASSPHPGH